MSGPKSDSYYVSAQASAAARRRAREEARSRRAELLQINSEVEETARRFSGERLGIDLVIPDEPDQNASLNEIERYRRRLQDLASARAAALGAAVTRVTLRSALGDLAGPAVGSLETVDDLGLSANPSKYDRRRRRPAAETPRPLDRRAIRKRADQRIRSLDRETSAEARSGIDDVLERLAAAETRGMADMLLSELSKRVEDANGDAEDLRRRREEARALLDEIEALEGPDVDRVRRELQAVESGGRALTGALRKQAAAAASAGKGRYADQVLRDALDHLGYAVDEPFDTLFASGGTLHFRKPGWNEYSVRLRVDGDDASMNYNVVRDEEEAAVSGRERALRDEEMERTWCSEFAALREALDEAGLKCEARRRIEPGELPVLVRKPAEVRGRDRRRSAQAPKEKEREL